MKVVYRKNENDPDAAVILEEALKKECKNRDMSVAKEPMPNFKSTPGGEYGMPLSFWASWELADRPRRIALLLDDCMEEYRDYASGILPNLSKLVEAFRAKKSTHEGVCITWSVWSRQYDDGISNAQDRWYGSRGLNPESPENAVYIFEGDAGLKVLSEIEPNDGELAEGWFYHAQHLDMFWTFDDEGNSYLDEKLKALDIDTVVIAGLWTDECILATTYAASSRGYDTVLVGDAVATATDNQETALTIANGTVAKVLDTNQVVAYMNNDFETGAPGAFKGKKYPDGRKDD